MRSIARNRLIMLRYRPTALSSAMRLAASRSPFSAASVASFLAWCVSEMVSAEKSGMIARVIAHDMVPEPTKRFMRARTTVPKRAGRRMLPHDEMSRFV